MRERELVTEKAGGQGLSPREGPRDRCQTGWLWGRVAQSGPGLSCRCLPGREDGTAGHQRPLPERARPAGGAELLLLYDTGLGQLFR